MCSQDSKRKKMKHSILSIFLITSSALPSTTPQIPSCSQTQPQTLAKADDDKDGKVVAESMGTMVQALATFSQNPNNPVVAGTCALQALGAFIKMLIQIFDDFAPTRSLKTQEEIENWFVNLPREKQIEIIQLMLAYARITKE